MCVFGWIGFVIIYLLQRMATGLQGEMLQLHQAFLELEVLCSKSDLHICISSFLHVSSFFFVYVLLSWYHGTFNISISTS